MESIQAEEDKPFDAPQLTGRLLELSDNPVAFTYCLREALRCAWQGGFFQGQVSMRGPHEANPYNL